MNLETAMKITKRCGGGSKIKLIFTLDKNLTSETKKALQNLQGMNFQYYVLDGAALRIFETMIVTGQSKPEVTIELAPYFKSHRRQFFEPLINTLELIELL